MALAGEVVANTDARPQGMAILTVGGHVDMPNRGASYDDTRSMFIVLGLEFDEAVAFDAEGLAALDQGAYDRSLFDGGFTGTFSGPRLSAILQAVGRPDAAVTAVALDQYRAEIPAEVIIAYDPILATHLNGQPLGIGGIGPAVVVFPDTGDPEDALAFDAYEVWATVYLGVD
ncbi:MAG: hypothetical protein AAGH83_04505 [Pseudomonadota bacterium]